jgi:hypothetical protein
LQVYTKWVPWGKGTDGCFDSTSSGGTRWITPRGTLMVSSSLSPETTIALPKIIARIKQRTPMPILYILIPLNIYIIF